MSSKFAGLSARVSQSHRVEIIDPISDTIIKDKNGEVCFIEVMSADSEAGRAFDKEQRSAMRRRAMKSRTGIAEPGDPLEENIRKCAVLTKSWHLVDPATREIIDVPCNPENAEELYSAPGIGWLFPQVWVAANDAANFMTRSSPTSSSSPSTSSDAAAS